MDGGGPVFGPSGGYRRGSTPQYKLTHCNEHECVSKRRFDFISFIGLLFLTPGLFLEMIGIPLFFKLDSIAFGFLTFGMGAFCCYIGIVSLQPVTLTINIEMGTWRRKAGWRVCGREESGLLQEFNSVLFHNNHGMGWHISLQTLLKRNREIHFDLHTADFENAKRIGFEVASLLNLPYVDENGNVIEQDILELPKSVI